MNQIKIGEFIKACRKEKNMTQQDLASIIHVEAKTISKWETGNGLPDTSIMYDLTKALDISLNELFIGEHITDNNQDKIGDAILETIEKENKMNKKNFVAEMIIGISLIIIVTSALLFASFVPTNTSIRLAIIIISIIVMIATIIGLVILDSNIGYYKCPKCNELFIISTKQYVKSLHTFKKRTLTCPKCKQTSWCDRVLTRK